jgi:pimeloyl-ACP methyl ester carboxylesterase
MKEKDRPMTAPARKIPRKHLRLSDLRGAARLATQATSNVAHIAEGVHQAVLSGLGVPAGDAPGRTRGITGLVYRSIHGVTELVGQGIDAVLARLEPPLEPGGDAAPPETPRREAVLAAFNGVMGDRLAAADNPLAIPMTLRHRGEPLTWPVVSSAGELKSKALLLIHGLCMNDRQWKTRHENQTVDHGEALSSAMGYSPVYLRYNTGRHISHNGRELSAQLEKLVAHWPVAVEELTVVAHSMGGLVIRSAVHYGRLENLTWPERLKKIVFLGTPHHGAPLERAGHWVDRLLPVTPFSAPFARLARLRSAGITDLRHGHVVEEDWRGHDRFHRRADSRRIVPLPEGVDCYAVAATTASKRGPLADRLIGDGLVPLHSALGHHSDQARCLKFEKSSQWIAYRMNHWELLSHPEVTRRIMKWLDS